MEKTYQSESVEKQIYSLWEKGGYFTPEIPRGGRKKAKPFTIILPLPNANDPMHIGHALFTIQDIMIRYHRMLGEPTLWLPGGDHAGIETQFVFEKELAQKGRSRFDFDRETLYRMIVEFVEKNKNINKEQMKILGFSLDWSRYHYSLEPKIVKKVLETFGKLHQDGLIYRAGRIVNYCTRCGTAFSDLEIRYQDSQTPLYYLKYGPFTLATTRPETKFGDTAVAVHPKDKRYRKLVGKVFTYESLIGLRKMKVIADELVDPDFGTGAVKVTPAHDPNDFEMAQRHKLPVIKVIDYDGRLNKLTGRFSGLTVKEARKKVVEELAQKGDLVKVDENYENRVGHCYRCGTIIEPLVMPQWYVKAKPLAEPAVKAVREGRTKIIPRKRFEKMFFDWLENIRDWNISRQIVWGPRIPAWYCLNCNPEIRISFVKNGLKIEGTWQELQKKYRFGDVKTGLQSLTAPVEASYQLKPGVCRKCGGSNRLQETDTFDTWFLSGQWPLTTLGHPDHPDFKYFYPTSVLDTLWDILFFWVARMMMFGLYLAGDVPFEVVHLHARVVDEKGQKMSKSKFNVVNPLETVEKYGADSLRLALVFGVSPGSDIALGDDKVRSMRNFVNKVWNIGRFIILSQERQKTGKDQKILFYTPEMNPELEKEDLKILKDLQTLIGATTKHLKKYRFDLALEGIYQFIWHRFADEYLEYSKGRLESADPRVAAVLRHVYLNCLKLLHPFAPFVTEEIWRIFAPYRKYQDPLVISKWPV